MDTYINYGHTHIHIHTLTCMHTHTHTHTLTVLVEGPPFEKANVRTVLSSNN